MKTFATLIGAVLLLAVGFFFYELKRPPSYADATSGEIAVVVPRPPPAISYKPPSGPIHVPPAAAKVKPVPYVLPREMRDPEHLPLRHPVMAGPPTTPPPNPLELPRTERVARGGTVP
jgi:hypothetical protein